MSILTKLSVLTLTFLMKVYNIKLYRESNSIIHFADAFSPIPTQKM